MLPTLARLQSRKHREGKSRLCGEGALESLAGNTRASAPVAQSSSSTPCLEAHVFLWPSLPGPEHACSCPCSPAFLPHSLAGNTRAPAPSDQPSWPRTRVLQPFSRTPWPGTRVLLPLRPSLLLHSSAGQRCSHICHQLAWRGRLLRILQDRAQFLPLSRKTSVTPLKHWPCRNSPQFRKREPPS